MTTALLQTTYFGPVQWYQKLNRYDRCIIEQYDSYQKQTYRNRCIIATANGTQALTVPVEHNHPLASQCHTPKEGMNNGQLVKDLRISDHNQWRRVHWNALQSAYSESPFFEYYADDIRPFFEQKYEFLVDFNEAIRETVCQLIDIHPRVVHSSQFIVHSPLSESVASQSQLKDFRDVISAKHPQADPAFTAKSYWQVFQHKHGFLPNLSILDLLFNMGPESVFYL
jgi:hypothetical protein